jgi:hypothetical protein
VVQLGDAGVSADTAADILLLDIGCGDSRVLSAVAQKFGCECRGWEIDMMRVHEAGLDRISLMTRFCLSPLKHATRTTMEILLNLETYHQLQQQQK